jgi:hypothetical protein
MIDELGQIQTIISSVAGGGIQIGSVQITTSSIAFVDNNGNVTQNVAASSSIGGTVSDYVTTSSFNSYTQSVSQSFSASSTTFNQFSSSLNDIYATDYEVYITSSQIIDQGEF